MIRSSSLPLLALLAACSGQSPEQNLQNAAAQSDPAAAAVLNNAAEAGVDPQQALEAAGQAAAGNAAGDAQGARPPSGTVQARPNLPGSPNRKDGSAPPDRTTVGENKTGVSGGTETGIRPETEAGPE
jgi:hypothetical protein